MRTQLPAQESWAVLRAIGGLSRHKQSAGLEQSARQPRARAAPPILWKHFLLRLALALARGAVANNLPAAPRRRGLREECSREASTARRKRRPPAPPASSRRTGRTAIRDQARQKRFSTRFALALQARRPQIQSMEQAPAP